MEFFRDRDLPTNCARKIRIFRPPTFLKNLWTRQREGAFPFVTVNNRIWFLKMTSEGGTHQN